MVCTDSHSRIKNMPVSVFLLLTDWLCRTRGSAHLAALMIGLFYALSSNAVLAASMYLPLSMQPNIERKVDKLFVLADMPIIKRPIPISQIRLAVEKTRTTAPQLSSDVDAYLQRFNRGLGFTHLSVKANLDQSENDYSVPNSYGLLSSSKYHLGLGAYATLGDWAIVNIAENYNSGNNQTRTDLQHHSFISLGTPLAQVDIGYRPHWLGPFKDSDMLISTNAQTMPGITLSNTKAFNMFGIDTYYELFLLKMSESSLIRSTRDLTQVKRGSPRLFGTHLSFQPFSGFAIGFNRLMQFGGGDRDDRAGSVAEAFFVPRDADNIDDEGRDFGNQLSSITTRYTFPGTFPISAYMEFAGEDTSASSRYHLGNTAVMFGVHLPEVLNHLDIRYETAEWQNLWYVNANYGDGLTNYEGIVGHWGAERRRFSDGVGARADTLSISYEHSSRDNIVATFRRLENAEPRGSNYETSREIDLSYTRKWQNSLIELNAVFGESVFGESYHRLTVGFRW